MMCLEMVLFVFYFCFTHTEGIICLFFFFQAEDGIRDDLVTGVQTCALPIYSCHFVSGVSRRVQPKMKKIAAAFLFAALAACALWLCLNLKITQNYSDFVVGRIAWSAATKWQDLMAMPFFMAFACVSIAFILSAQRSRAFFSDIAQGVEREDSIGLDAGGAGSIAKRWRRPRSDPEYTERRSDAVQAAEKCSKARGEASIP